MRRAWVLAVAAAAVACGGGASSRRCLPRPAGEAPPVAAPAEKNWYAWTTPQGWLHVGTRQELERPQPVREEIWGGTSDAPLEKRKLSIGPWATQAEALDAVCARLTKVRISRQPSAHPPETVVATIEGREVHVQLGRGMLPEDVFWTAQQYDHGEQLRILHEHGISPRLVFAKPRWLVHATGVGTMDGPRQMDAWFLLYEKPVDGGFTLPDGMGGTFGYSSDRALGPYRDNFELAPVLRELGVSYVDDVSADLVLPQPIDHGLPRCPQ